MKEKFNLFASQESAEGAAELETDLPVSESVDESELVANDITESTGADLTDVSSDSDGLDSLDTDIEGLQKDIEIAEGSIAETGVAPEATVESIRMRIEKARRDYGFNFDTDGKHFSKENYTSIAVSKTLSTDIVDSANAALEGMIGGFFKSIGIAFARTFKTLENIEKGANEMISELKALKPRVGELKAGGLDGGNAKGDLAKGNVWSGNKIDSASFGQLLNRNAKATNEINNSQSTLRTILDEVQQLIKSKDVTEEGNSKTKALKAKLAKVTDVSLGTKTEPLAGNLFVNVLPPREDHYFDAVVEVGKGEGNKGDVRVSTIEGKTLSRMIDTVVNLLESTVELYQDFRKTANTGGSTGNYFGGVFSVLQQVLSGYEDGKRTKEGRAKFNADVAKRIVNNMAKFYISYMNKAVGNVGQSNLRLAKMLITYANASLKAKPAESAPEA